MDFSCQRGHSPTRKAFPLLRAWFARRRSAEGREPLATWASERGFSLVDPTDPALATTLAAAFGLAAEPGVREIGTVLLRATACGRVLLIDSWWMSPRETTALLETDAILRPRSWEPEGLPAGSRVQLAPGRIAMHVPAVLTPELADDLVARLTQLDAALPRVPGSNRK